MSLSVVFGSRSLPLSFFPRASFELLFVEVREKLALGNYGVEPDVLAGMWEERFMTATQDLAEELSDPLDP